jgi:sirohydrochlorin cobaltochelatase
MRANLSRLILLLLVSVLGLVLAASPVLAGSGHGQKRPVKKGILLVTFGTSIPEAQEAFDFIEAKARERFPGVEIRWAFTSRIIRDKLLKEEGKVLDSPAVALARMAEAGFTHLAVQSLHVIPGAEFHGLYTTCKAFEGLPEGLERVLVGRPLLSSHEDMVRVAEAMLAAAPKERKRGEGLVLMGHGTHFPANAVYPAMAYVFQRIDSEVFVGTVEGYPELEDIKADLIDRKIKKVYLIPLMSVAGDHAVNDLAGEEEDSWKSVLTAAGIECVPVLKGIALYPRVAEVWLDHLSAAFSHFQPDTSDH